MPGQFQLIAMDAVGFLSRRSQLAAFTVECDTDVVLLYETPSPLDSSSDVKYPLEGKHIEFKQSVKYGLDRLLNLNGHVTDTLSDVSCAFACAVTLVFDDG